MRAILKRIHINMHEIRHNKTSGDNRPVITVKVGGRNLRAHEVNIDGPSRVVYAPDDPLSCGARVWVETTAPLRLECDGVESNVR